MNKRTAVITDEQYDNLVNLIYNGGKHIRANKGMAVALIITGNCGLRIGDCLSLKLSDFVKQGDNHYFNITEEKTGKKRQTIIPEEVYQIVRDYADGKKKNEPIFDFGVRAIQKKIQKATDILGYEGIGSHSMRKRVAQNAYERSGHDIELVRTLLNHSSVSTTQRYLGLKDQAVNKILLSSVNIPIKEV